MSEWYLSIAGVLLLNAITGFIRILRGPTRADRMLAAQFFGTNGVAIVLLLAFALPNFALLDVALLFALLASIATAAFVSHAWEAEESQKELVEL